METDGQPHSVITSADVVCSGSLEVFLINSSS